MDLHHASSIITKKHFGQNRKASEIPYVTHLFEVMKITQKMYDSFPLNVKGMILDEGIHRNDLLISALFHDLIEDTDSSYDVIKHLAGEKIADLVMEMSRPEDDGTSFSHKYHWLVGFKHKSFSSIVIKIADRYANVKDYIDAGKYKYAGKYALQAFPLYYFFGKKIKDKVENIENMGYFEEILDDLDIIITETGGRSLLKLFFCSDYFQKSEEGIFEDVETQLGIK